jgi:hypothetical protein
MGQNKHTNVTLSFPVDLNALLHAKVARSKISKYVAESVRKSLIEDEEREAAKLEAAYEKANSDLDRLKAVSEWNDLDNSDDIEGWEW